MAGEPRGAEPWTPSLHVRDTGNGCRLTLDGLAHGHGESLQDAADDLVRRLLNMIMCIRATGFRPPSTFGRPDRRVLDLLWELGEIAESGGDIRARIFGFIPEG